MAVDSGRELATTAQVWVCAALLKQAEEDAHLGEHAFLIQQGQNAHTLGRACFNQVHTLLIVLKLHQSPVHSLSSVHFLLQLEQMPAMCQNTLVLYMCTPTIHCLVLGTHIHATYCLVLYIQDSSCALLYICIHLVHAQSLTAAEPKYQRTHSYRGYSHADTHAACCNSGCASHVIEELQFTMSSA